MWFNLLNPCNGWSILRCIVTEIVMNGSGSKSLPVWRQRKKIYTDTDLIWNGFNRSRTVQDVQCSLGCMFRQLWENVMITFLDYLYQGLQQRIYNPNLGYMYESLSKKHWYFFKFETLTNFCPLIIKTLKLPNRVVFPLIKYHRQHGEQNVSFNGFTPWFLLSISKRKFSLTPSCMTKNNMTIQLYINFISLRMYQHLVLVCQWCFNFTSYTLRQDMLPLWLFCSEYCATNGG